MKNLVCSFWLLHLSSLATLMPKGAWTFTTLMENLDLFLGNFNILQSTHNYKYFERILKKIKKSQKKC